MRPHQENRSTLRDGILTGIQAIRLLEMLRRLASELIEDFRELFGDWTD
jgi:hypothetical protein